MDSLLLRTTRHQRRCLSQHWRHCWRQCELVGPTSKSHHHNQLTRPDLELCSDSIPCNKQPQYLTSNRSLSVTKITREDTLFTYACKISSLILRKCHWLSSVTVCTIQMLWLLLLLFTIIVIIIKYSKRHARKNKISHWILGYTLGGTAMQLSVVIQQVLHGCDRREMGILFRIPPSTDFSS